MCFSIFHHEGVREREREREILREREMQRAKKTFIIFFSYFFVCVAMEREMASGDICSIHKKKKLLCIQESYKNVNE